MPFRAEPEMLPTTCAGEESCLSVCAPPGHLVVLPSLTTSWGPPTTDRVHTSALPCAFALTEKSSRSLGPNPARRARGSARRTSSHDERRNASPAELASCSALSCDPGSTQIRLTMIAVLEVRFQVFVCVSFVPLRESSSYVPCTLTLRRYQSELPVEGAEGTDGLGPFACAAGTATARREQHTAASRR